MAARQPLGQALVLAPGPPAPCPLLLRPWVDLDRQTPLDCHLHTNFTDGRGSPAEMVAAARQAGLRQLLFSEHVRRDSTYFPEFAAQVRSLAEDGMSVLVGVETKILDRTGSLDCPPGLVEQCQAIIGSVHSPPGDGGLRAWHEMGASRALELEYALALAIIRHSRAQILGHPLGMAIKIFQLKPQEQLYQLALACREHGKAFELNPRYCSDPSLWLQIVQAADCRVSLGSDAHGPEDVGRAWRVFVEGKR